MMKNVEVIITFRDPDGKLAPNGFVMGIEIPHGDPVPPNEVRRLVEQAYLSHGVERVIKDGLVNLLTK